MDNWINFDNLPKRKDGKISWKDCDHNLVEFCFDDIQDRFIIVKRIKRHYVLVEYAEKQFIMNTDSLLFLRLESLVRLNQIVENKNNPKCDFDINDFNYKPGDLINTCYGEIIIISEVHLLKSKTKGYYVKHCLYDERFIVTEYELVNNINIKRIGHKSIKIGYNDIWFTHPDIGMFFENKNEPYLFEISSSKSVVIKCPNCNKVVGKRNINSLKTFHCPFCSDGISFPNRLMANTLRELNISFESEVRFDWCVFPKYNNNGNSFGRYDFLVPNNNLIIEMDGGIGHGNKPHCKSNISKEELIYRDKQKDLLAKKHGYKVIRVDCNYKKDRFNYCKDNIVKQLSEYFNFDSVNWDAVQKGCLTGRLIQSVELYKLGYTSVEIANLLDCDYTSILEYLYKADELGLCKYYKRVHLVTNIKLKESEE